MSQKHEYDGWSYARLRENHARAHFLLEEPYRFVTVILSEKPDRLPQLYCLDSPCYHAAGPLGEGDILEIENIPCLRCPTHHFLVALDSGEEVIMERSGSVGRHDHGPLPVYPLQPLDPHANGTVARRGKCVQRTHKVSLDETTGILCIEVQDEAILAKHPLPSDGIATSIRNGGMCMQIADIKAKGLH